VTYSSSPALCEGFRNKSRQIDEDLYLSIVTIDTDIRLERPRR